MNTSVKARPDGYHTVTPYITVDDASSALAFYQKALGAEEVMRIPGPDGRICHAEIRIGDSRVMLADEFPDLGARSPKSLGGISGSLMVYVDDVDESFARAVAAGATVLRPVKNQFYGDRSGCVTDPFGHTWTFATHVEDVSPEEMNARMAAAMP